MRSQDAVELVLHRSLHVLVESHGVDEGEPQRGRPGPLIDHLGLRILHGCCQCHRCSHNPEAPFGHDPVLFASRFNMAADWRCRT